MGCGSGCCEDDVNTASMLGYADIGQGTASVPLGCISSLSKIAVLGSNTEYNILKPEF
jgi:hypothetical protein